MSLTPHRGLRAVAAAAGLALLAGPLALAGGADAQPRRPGLQPIELDLLAINDFHGNLEKIPSTSSSGRINNTPAGGVEYLARHLESLRNQAACERRQHPHGRGR